MIVSTKKGERCYNGIMNRLVNLLFGRHCGKGTCGSFVPIGIDIFDTLLSTKDADEFLGVVKDLDVAELELVIDDSRSKAEDFYLFAFALVFFVGSREGSPMAPGKANLWWATEDLEDLPWKGCKCIVELVVRILPGDIFGIPDVCRARVEQNVVVSDLLVG